jgi:hypothetical protein
MTKVKFPDVTVVLLGNNGNAFYILGAVKQAMREAGVSKSEFESYYAEATAGDYDHLLQTTLRWVNVV